MTTALIALLVAVIVLLIVAATKDAHDDDLGAEIRDIREADNVRRRKLIALNKAYTLAREELGEEPTIEQIMLTRDTMEDVDGTP